MADYLTDLIGQDFVIEDDVRVILGPNSHLVVSQATIPSVLVDGVNLAELDILELDLEVSKAIWGNWAIDDIKINGIRINLTTTPDGTTSWANGVETPKSSQAQPIVGPIEANGIIWFLSDKTVDVKSVQLNVDNQATGFEFLYDLEEMTIVQFPEDAGVEIASRGTVNGFPFEIDGNYPRGETSETSLALGEFNVEFEGRALPEAEGGGIGGDLSIDTGGIGEFLDILKLDGKMEGQAVLNTRLTSQNGRLEATGLQATLNLQNGTEIDLEGAVSDLVTVSGLDVLINGRFFPVGHPPKRATKIQDLKLSTAQARIVNAYEGFRLADARIDTNLFETEFESFGPFSIEKIWRTEEGTLALQDIYVQAGPEEAPYLVATGDIIDLLRTRGIEFAGALRAPISLIVNQFKNDVAEAFGNISAGFEVSDASGQLALTKMLAKSENTTLWSMTVSAVTRSFRSLKGTDLDLDFDIPDGAAFLAALQADKVDVGGVSFSTSITGIEHGLDAQMSLGIGETSIDGHFDATVDVQEKPKVRGGVHSDDVRMIDVSRAVKSVVSVTRTVEEAAHSRQEKDIKVDLQQLVIVNESTDVSVPDSTNKPVLQPLVLEGPEETVGGQSVTSEPVDIKDLKIADLFDLGKLQRDIDLQIDVDIERIEGQAGISRISSALVTKDGQASLGPLDFSYGTGRAHFGAAVDLIKTPKYVRLNGSTSGWNIGEILDGLGVGVKVHGILNGEFDLTGRRVSIRNFINTMNGSVVLSMKNGDIATSMLELAGLGLFPWLFSQEFRQGYTEIVCLKAPLKIRAGTVSTSEAVMETRRVQLVGEGVVDWVKDQIALHVEPRPIGRPLARSAWPFEVSGRLSNPKFSIDRGHRRVHAKRAFKADGTTGRKPCVPDFYQ